MVPNWLKLASLAQKLVHSTVFRSMVHSLLPKDTPFIEHIELHYSWCYRTVITVKRLPVLHHSV